MFNNYKSRWLRCIIQKMKSLPARYGICQMSTVIVIILIAVHNYGNHGASVLSISSGRLVNDESKCLLCQWRAWSGGNTTIHDDVIKWKHFPRYWPFVRGAHRSPVNSPHKGQWRGALMFSLICVWINGWVNNREAGDLRRYHAHYDVSAMSYGYNIYQEYAHDSFIAMFCFLGHCRYASSNGSPRATG